MPQPLELPPVQKPFLLGYDKDDVSWPIVALHFDQRDGRGQNVPPLGTPAPTGDFCTGAPDYPDAYVFVGATLLQPQLRMQWTYRILPGPWTDPTTHPDDDGKLITVMSRDNLAANIHPGETDDGGQWTKTSAEDTTKIITKEIVESRPYPGNPIPSAVGEQDGEVATSATILTAATLITPSVSEAGGVITTVDQESVSDLMSRQKTTQKPWLDNAEYAIRIPEFIPQRFLVQIPVDSVTHTLAGTATMPTLTAGDIERIERQLTKQLYSLTVTTRDLSVLPLTLTEIAIDKEGVESTIEFTLDLGPQTLNPSNLPNFAEGEVTNLGSDDLGNDYTMKTEVYDTLPSPFIQSGEPDTDGVVVLTNRRKNLFADITPSEIFDSGNKIVTSAEGVNGTIAWEVVRERPLPGNELDGASSSIPRRTPGKYVNSESVASSIEKVEAGTSPDAVTNEGDVSSVEPVSLTESRKKTDLLTLSKGSTTDYTLNAHQQLVTVAGSVGTDGSAPSITALTESIKVEALGGGEFERVIGSVASVFDPNLQSARQDIEIDPKFLAADAQVTEDTDVTAGTDTTPATLGDSGTGIISSEVVREDETKIRSTTRELLGALNDSRTEYDYYQGLLATVSDEYSQSISVPTLGYLDVSFSVMGKPGEYNEIKHGTVESFPDQVGQKYNARLDLVEIFTESTIANQDSIPGSPTNRIDISPEDYARMRQRTYDISQIQTAMAAFVRSFPGKSSIELPPVLQSISISVIKSAGAGAGSMSGGGSGTGTNWSYDTKGSNSSEGNTTAVPELISHTKYQWGRQKDVVDYMGFIAGPNITQDDVIAWLLSAFTVTAVAWPNFTPGEAMVLTHGQNVRMRVSAEASVHEDSWANDSGAGSSNSSSSGTEQSYSVENIARVYTFPPSLHDNIPISSNDTQDATCSAEVDLTTTTAGPVSLTQTATSLASFTIGPTDQIDWPSSGLYIYGLDCESTDYGMIMVRARVYDMANN